MKIKSILLSFLFIAVLVFSVSAQAPSGKITIDLNPKVNKDSKNVKLFVPYPMSDEFQTINDIEIKGNFLKSQILRDASSNAVYLFLEWEDLKQKPAASLSFHISQISRKNPDLKEVKAPFPADIKKYLQPSDSVPSDDLEMKAIAEIATKGKTTVLDKAKGVYDWVVKNTYRDPKVQGCGIGNAKRTLNECSGGGKCADLSSVFVTIARAAGIPSRDVYGLRLSSPKEGDITSGFHCWAEFYLPGTGWVMVDPADVRKMMLVHKLKLKDADDWRSFFWGGDDLFRVVLEKDSRDVNLEGLGEKLNYFMYPAAVVDGKLLNHFDAKNFSYSVKFKKD